VSLPFIEDVPSSSILLSHPTLLSVMTTNALFDIVLSKLSLVELVSLVVCTSSVGSTLQLALKLV